MPATLLVSPTEEANRGPPTRAGLPRFTPRKAPRIVNEVRTLSSAGHRLNWHAGPPGSSTRAARAGSELKRPPVGQSWLSRGRPSGRSARSWKQAAGRAAAGESRSCDTDRTTSGGRRSWARALRPSWSPHDGIRVGNQHHRCGDQPGHGELHATKPDGTGDSAAFTPSIIHLSGLPGVTQPAATTAGPRPACRLDRSSASRVHYLRGQTAKGTGAGAQRPRCWIRNADQRGSTSDRYLL